MAQGEQKNTLTKKKKRGGGLSHISEDTDVTFFDNSISHRGCQLSLSHLQQQLLSFWSFWVKDSGESADLQQASLMTSGVFRDFSDL